MRIPCPCCGPRIHEEFSYLGDARLRARPVAVAPDARSGANDPANEQAFSDYVYLRDNPAGVHRELWFHGAGCQNWLIVVRDTRSHAVLGASLARGEAPSWSPLTESLP